MLMQAAEDIKENSFLHKVIYEGLILLSKIPDKKFKKWIDLGKTNLQVAYFAPY